MKMISKNKTLIFGTLTTIFSTGLLLWCFKKVDWQRFLENIEHVDVKYLALGFGVTFVIILAKSLQIKIYLPKEHRIPYKNIFHVVAIYLMTASLLPFWGGHALFVYLLGKREKVGPTVALSIITVDQVLDGFGKLAVFLAVALWVPFPDWMGEGIRAFLVLFSVAYIVVFFLAYRYRDPSHDRSVGLKGLKKIGEFFRKWAHYLKPIHDIKKISLVILLAIFFRVLEALAVMTVQKAFGVQLPLYSSLLIVAALSLATVLPFAPGRMGVFEAAVFMTYQYMGVDATQAMAMALFVHMVHSLPFILTGWLTSLKVGFRRSELKDETDGTLLLEPVES